MRKEEFSYEKELMRHQRYHPENDAPSRKKMSRKKMSPPALISIIVIIAIPLFVLSRIGREKLYEGAVKHGIIVTTPYVFIAENVHSNDGNEISVVSVISICGKNPDEYEFDLHDLMQSDFLYECSLYFSKYSIKEIDSMYVNSPREIKDDIIRGMNEPRFREQYYKVVEITSLVIDMPYFKGQSYDPTLDYSKTPPVPFKQQLKRKEKANANDSGK